jgi:small-conductance mechanosensitive channel
MTAMSATVIERAGDQLGTFLPRIVGALLLVLVGLLVASILGRITRKALVRAGLDRLGDRSGASALLAQGGLGGSLSALVATAVKLTIAIVACFAAMTLLGLEFLSDSLNSGILFIPRLLTALALVLIGIVIGAVARAWVERTSAQLDFPVSIGPVVQVTIIAIFGLCAAAQAGVSVGPLFAIALVLVGAVAVTLSLAFGLGAREVARSLSSGRYARADFEVGQTVRVDDVRGEILRIDAAAVTLRAGDETIRVPNSIMVERIVVIEHPEQSNL